MEDSNSAHILLSSITTSRRIVVYYSEDIPADSSSEDVLIASHLFVLLRTTNTCSRDQLKGRGRDKGRGAADPMTGRGNRNGATPSPAHSHGHRPADLVQIKTLSLACRHTSPPRRAVPAQRENKRWHSCNTGELRGGLRDAATRGDMLPRRFLSLSLELRHSFKPQRPRGHHRHPSLARSRICSSLPREATYHAS